MGIMCNTKYETFLICFWIMVNVAQCYEIRCNYTCDVHVILAKRYICKEQYSYSYSYSSDIPAYTFADLWENWWRSSVAIDRLIVSNGNNCSVPMKVYDEVFKKFPNILDFHMNNSDIGEVSYGNFRQGNSLKNLSLSHNDIKELPSFLFGSSWNLQYLDLSFNKIEKISANAFEKHNERSYYPDDYDERKFELTFLNLQHIYLDNNLISFLESNLFSSLKNLVILTLNNNLLQEIDGSGIFGTISGWNLYLNSNRLTKISNIGINFKFLNISDNPKIESNNELVVNALYAELININAKALIIGDRAQHIFSSHNEINSFYPISENNSTEFSLEELDLAFNSLYSMRNLTLFKSLIKVNLAYNSLEVFDAGIFEKLSSLKYLNLSHNKFDEFDSNIFLYTNLLSLDVSYNRLEYFNANVTADKLRTLYLAGNYLTAIDSNIQQNMPHLRWLSMHDNNWNCEYLTRKILVLMMYNILIERAVFDSANNERNYDSNIKGIGCFTQSDNVRRQIQLRRDIEFMIDQRLTDFESKVSEQILALASNYV